MVADIKQLLFSIGLVFGTDSEGIFLLMKWFYFAVYPGQAS